MGRETARGMPPAPPRSSRCTGAYRSQCPPSRGTRSGASGSSPRKPRRGGRTRPGLASGRPGRWWRNTARSDSHSAHRAMQSAPGPCQSRAGPRRPRSGSRCGPRTVRVHRAPCRWPCDTEPIVAQGFSASVGSSVGCRFGPQTHGEQGFTRHPSGVGYVEREEIEEGEAKSLISQRRGWDLNPRNHEGSHDFESCRFNRAHAPLRRGPA